MPEFKKAAAAAGKDTQIIHRSIGPDVYAVGAGGFLGPHDLCANVVEVDIIVPRTGTLKNMYVRCSANTLNGDAVVQADINGVGTALQVTLAAGVLSGSDLVNEVAVTAGQRVSIEIWDMAGAGQIDDLRATFEIEY